MLTTGEALNDLETRLAKAGVDPDLPDVALAVKAFRDFSDAPVEVHDDSLIFECGLFDDREGVPRWMWSLKRQFAHEPFDDQQIVEHLQMNCYFAREPGSPAPSVVESSYDHASAADFWSFVESLPAFQQGLTHGAPVGFEVFQEEV